MVKSWAPLAAVAGLLLVTMASSGCIEVDIARQLVDIVKPEEERRVDWVEAPGFPKVGFFAPDPDQDPDELREALDEMLANPLSAPDILANISWDHYSYSFDVEEGVKGLLIQVAVDWKTANGPNRLGGTVEVVVTDPNGEVCSVCQRKETKTPNLSGDEVEDVAFPIIPPHMPGQWTIDISGSGFDGFLKNGYSGDYTLGVKAKVPVSA